jgi:ribosome-binding ATPase YchF (GTP1/OBG family)
LSPEQQRAIKSFQLFSQKPRLVVLNLAEDVTDASQLLAAAPTELRIEALSVLLQLELSQMSQSECQSFCNEMGVTVFDRGQLLRTIMDTSDQLLFFTGGPKEVRTWMIPKGATAGDAAASIHTDLERGFVRAEAMNCDDLFRLGSEREVKAQHLMRHEHKGYIVQEGDILHILSSK